jgi:hypothetical protein
MKKLAAAATILVAGIVTAAPARAGHDVHVGGQFVHVSPGFSFGIGFGSPAFYPYGYAAAPVYVAPPPAYVAPPGWGSPATCRYGPPVVVAPHPCGARLHAHYVWKGGRYHRHPGHGGHRGHGGHHHHGRR